MIDQNLLPGRTAREQGLSKRSTGLFIIVLLTIYLGYIQFPSISSTTTSIAYKCDQQVTPKAASGGNATTTDFPTANPGEDTAIIITSSWIKSFPTLYFIDKVVESLQLIEGLSPLAPLYIAVDGLRLKGLDHQEIEVRLEQLDRYVKLLYHRFDLQNLTKIHIVVSQKHLHISGNVQKMLALIEDHHPSVKYLYYLQHDFSFRKGVNHTALVEVVRENKNVDLVRFLYRDMGSGDRRSEVDAFCKSTPPIKSGGMVLHSTRKYSDNNHFARLDYYKKIMDSLGPIPRAPEGPMQYSSMKSLNCSELGIWVYHTALGQKLTLDHLDGRLTDEIPVRKSNYSGP